MNEAFGESMAFFTIISVFVVLVAYKIWMPLETGRVSTKKIEDIH